MSHFFLWFFCVAFIVHCKPQSSPYNILLVVSDDLRADIGGYYGENDFIYTPNIDSFQNRAFTFTHAYTQIAVCNPTRTSFLTGLRPDTTRVWNNADANKNPLYFRNTMINNTGKTVITLPQYFKQYGNYYTVGSGKVFHPGPNSGGTNKCNLGDDMPYSWNIYWDCAGSVGNAKVASPAENGCINGTGCTQTNQCLQCFKKWNCYINNTISFQQLICPADCDDLCFQDQDVTDQTLRYFQQITNNKTLKNKPFFIAIGLRRPHTGWYTPLRFYETYGYYTNYSDIQIAKHRTLPTNAPILSSNNNSEVAKYDDVTPYLYYTNYTNTYVNNKTYTIKYVKDMFHSHLRGGYYSSVSFVDYQFGRIIQGLYKYGLWNNTIVLFTGDHGWHLGEQGLWAKGTNFEVATRVPLMIRIPGLNEGKKSDVLVEQLDIFPTLIDATIGFKYANISLQLEGKSLLNLIKNPNIFVDYYAYSQFPRNGHFTIMGLTMRTSEWRYTEWLAFNPGSNISNAYPIWNVSYGVELYNHSNTTIDENDMNAYDNYNLAYDDDMKSVIQTLHNKLYQTWDNQSWAINKQQL